MTPYPEYKGTDLAWLPKIPKHWKTRKIKYLFKERSEKGYPNEPLLAATQNHGVIPKKQYENRTVEAQKDLHLLKLVKVGDFVISLRSFQGGIEYAYYQGIISPAYTVIIPDETLLNAGYFRYLAKSLDFIALLQTCVTGIREGQNIDYTTLKRYCVSVPPADEQEKIVRYLDAMTAKINKLIRAKKKQITLLQEQKQAIINQAVTKGLNPATEMKDSGIDWLGPIPKHWIVNKTGHMYRSILGKMLANTPTSPDDTFENYLCAKDVHFYGVDTLDLKKMWFSPSEKSVYALQPGDLLVVEGGAGAGGSAIFYGKEKIFIQNSIHLVRARSEEYTVQFLYYWLYAMVKRGYIDFACNKATIPHFTKDKLFEMPFLAVPKAEQNSIVKYLDKQCADIDMMIAQCEKEIALALEYKNSLISSAVTGQIDLRNTEVEFVPLDDLAIEDDSNLDAEEESEPISTEESEE